MWGKLDGVFWIGPFLVIAGGLWLASDWFDFQSGPTVKFETGNGNNPVGEALDASPQFGPGDAVI